MVVTKKKYGVEKSECKRQYVVIEQEIKIVATFFYGTSLSTHFPYVNFLLWQ